MNSVSMSAVNPAIAECFTKGAIGFLLQHPLPVCDILKNAHVTEPLPAPDLPELTAPIFTQMNRSIPLSFDRQYTEFTIGVFDAKDNVLSTRNAFEHHRIGNIETHCHGLH